MNGKEKHDASNERGTSVVFDESDEAKFVFFWRPGQEPNGWLSNWSSHSFKDEGKHFSTAEHYIMYEKAIAMGDEDVAARILEAPSPKKAKELGREVSNYQEKLWSSKRDNVIIKGLTLKISQNPDLKQLLLETGDAIIAEASPIDKIWGIGLGRFNKHAKSQAEWRGQNILGKAWMIVRDSVTDSSS